MNASGWDVERFRRRLGIPVVEHGSVGSTMDEARREGPAPRLHVAREQRAGRGRHGRAWASPAGNLYATIVWPDPDEWLGPGVLAAIQSEIADAIRGAGGPPARCKWPNDGFVEGRKWCGLLAERDGNRGRVRIGLGANLESVPEGPALEATALRVHWPAGPPPVDVACLILEAALAVLRDGEAGIRRGLARWPAVDLWTFGDPLQVEGPDGLLEGRYGGVSADGRLVLQTAGGTTRLAAGDAVRLHRQEA
jgi:BirA family biotin operon repressor/biotin-[acetyl-CoA-carboxylase] ligase